MFRAVASGRSTSSRGQQVSSCTRPSGCRCALPDGDRRSADVRDARQRAVRGRLRHRQIHAGRLPDGDHRADHLLDRLCHDGLARLHRSAGSIPSSARASAAKSACRRASPRSPATRSSKPRSTGLFAFFGNLWFNAHLGVNIVWVVVRAGRSCHRRHPAAYRDVKLSAAVLGIALVLEVIMLA